ncbi:MAG: hypothetical protein ACI4KM_07405 [Oscillospiraceae bacterium]
MKKIIALLLCGVLLLTGCDGASGCTAVGSVEITTNTSIELTYQKLNGTKKYDMRLHEGDSLAVNVTTNSGSLTIEIAQKGEEPIYTGSVFPDGGFTVNIHDDGRYYVSLIAEEHSGGVKLEW